MDNTKIKLRKPESIYLEKKFLKLAVYSKDVSEKYIVKFRMLNRCNETWTL